MSQSKPSMKTKGLLDLPDDILNIIAHYVHQDTQIPFPSLNAHFENYRSSINGENNEDYLFFRATCRRTREVLQPRGLHVTLYSWDKLVRLNKSSKKRHFTDGIRRLIISISSYEYSHPAAQLTYDPRGMWNTLTNFPSSLKSLEELIIKELPLCFHKSGFNFIKYLPIPSIDFLPKVSSLGFEIECTCCSRHIPKLFIPAAPLLKHLKLMWSKGNISNLNNVMTTWSSRHPNQEFQLATLFIKSAGEKNHLEIFKDITNCFPMVKKLYMAPSWLNFHGHITPRITLCLPSTPTTDASGRSVTSIQHLKVLHDFHDYVLPVEQALRDEPSHTDPLFTSLSKLTNIITLDCCLEVELDTSPILEVLALSYHTKAEHEQLQLSSGNDLINIRARAKRHEQAMIEVAQVLCKHLPSLQSGYFWSFDGSKQDDNRFWCRWFWYKDSSSESPPQIVLSTIPDKYTLTFLCNKDGTAQPKYESDNEDDD